MSDLYTGHSRDASYEVSVHLAKRFQRRRISGIGLSGPCLLTNRDDLSNLYRGPSNKVSVHLAKPFKRRRISGISLSETRIAYGGHVC